MPAEESIVCEGCNKPIAVKLEGEGAGERFTWETIDVSLPTYLHRVFTTSEETGERIEFDPNTDDPKEFDGPYYVLCTKCGEHIRQIVDDAINALGRKEGSPTGT